MYTFVLILLLLTLPARAQTPPEALRVGLPVDYPPFASFDSTRKTWSGFDVEVLENFAASQHRRFEPVPMHWKNLLEDLAAGRFSIAGGGITITPERAARFDFSAPVLQDGKTPLAPCEKAQRFATLAEIDRPGVRVITNPGGQNEAFDRAHFSRATIIVYPDNRGIFAALAAGKADLMITDAVEARYQARRHPALCAVHPENPFSHGEKAYLLVRDAGLREAINRFLAESARDATLAALRLKWLGEN